MNKTAEEIYPYLENEESSIGIREHNQRMYDCRQAYNKGFAAAQFAAPPPSSEGEKAGMVSIEGQAELHANEYYEKGSNSEREMAEHELWLNRKYNFMAGAKWALATLPTREPEVKLVDQIEALRISELDKAKQYKRQFLTKVYHNENARALERVIKMLNDE